MLPFDAVSRWFGRVLRLLAGYGPGRRRNRHFTVTVTETAPALDGLQRSVVHVVRTNGKDRWAMLRCPCGCDGVVTLSLQNVHRPHWTLTQNNLGHPSLHPSVWRQEGCFSHFWIRDGQIHWC